MNATDITWQRLLDEACARWSALSADELRDLPQFAAHKTQSGDDEIEYALWHENPAEWPGLQVHSFVLQANRKLGVMFTRNYLAGFALDQSGVIVSISDEVLSHYD